MTVDDDNAPVGLDRLSSLSEEQRAALHGRWITTVDGFVAASATEAGRASLRALLALDAGGLSAALEAARALLGDARFGALRTPTPGGALGALCDEPRECPPPTSDAGGANA